MINTGLFDLIALDFELMLKWAKGAISELEQIL